MPRRRRSTKAVVLIGLGAGAVVLARSLNATRSPRRALDGSGPVTGSLDTWPPVPRAPQRPQGSA